MTSSTRNRRSLTTVNTSTSRLRHSARAGLSSAGGRSNVIPTLTTAASRTRARVDGIASAKKLSETHPGRELHRTGLRGHRAKGSAVVTTAATAPARRRCERGGGDGSFSVTLAGRRARGRCERRARAGAHRHVAAIKPARLRGARGRGAGDAILGPGGPRRVPRRGECVVRVGRVNGARRSPREWRAHPPGERR